MSLDLLVKLMYELSTVIVFFDIRYSMRDPLFDLDNLPDSQNSDACQRR